MASYKAQDFIDAIKGSGGIVSVVARRVGCNWHTAKRYITEYATVAQAFEDEKASMADIAESVLTRNIKIAFEKQKKDERGNRSLVDTSDAKWFLARKRRDEYSPRQELKTEISGPDGEPIKVEEALSNEQRIERINEILDTARERKTRQSDAAGVGEEA